MRWEENALFFEQQMVAFLECSFSEADAAHDMLHIRRVVKTATLLCRTEGADLNVLLPAAWLHDCVHAPKNSPDRSSASRLAAGAAHRLLSSLKYDQALLPRVFHAIEAHSFSAAIKPETIEAKVLQDADRLDALGAIGIARCFATSGALHRPFYSESDPFCAEREPDDALYALDHFYRKLLKLAATMQTHAGKQEAEKRTQFVKLYLDQLAQELM